jgi:magnesium-transporting ATPase (P-type)
MNHRSITVPFFLLNIVSNPQLLVALAVALGLQLLPFYLPPLNDVFDVSPLERWEWALIVPLAGVAFLGIEALKFLRPSRVLEWRARPGMSNGDDRTNSGPNGLRWRALPALTPDGADV